MDIEKECKNLQSILKSSANGSVRAIKRRNRRKYFKNMGWPNKTINRNKEENIKTAKFK